MKHGDPRFYKLIKEMEQIHSDKSHDYGGEDPLSNLREFGFFGIVVRLGDKWCRLKNFAKQGVLKVKNEKIRDTLLDMATYALLAIIFLDEENSDIEPVK